MTAPCEALSYPYWKKSVEGVLEADSTGAAMILLDLMEATKSTPEAQAYWTERARRVALEAAS